MRKARILVNNIEAGILEALGNNKYKFTYHTNYHAAPVSLTMPITQKNYEFAQFPAFFEGLLPEGILLAALLRKYKLDQHDYFSQLIKIGEDTVGAVTIEEVT